MIRFTLRQFRAQALVGLAALIVPAVLLLVTGPHLVHVYDTTVADCAKYNDCGPASSAFLRVDHGIQVALNVVVVVVPCVIGLFWGAPLIARELEAGTFRLAWTQGVSRGRWAVLKLGVVGLASMATAGALSLMVTWWSSPSDRVNMSLYSTFDQRGIVPVGFAAFAFALGVTSGVLIRRTLPAMATTLVVFVAVRLLVNGFVLGGLIPPTRGSYALVLGTTISGFGGPPGGPSSLFPGTPNLPNAWVLSSRFTDAAGHPLTAAVVKATCPKLGSLLGGPGPAAAAPVGGGGRVAVVGRAPAGAQQALQSCVSKIGATYREIVMYQPAHHYWPLQWSELALYLAVAVGLVGLSCRWVRRRIA